MAGLIINIIRRFNKGQSGQTMVMALVLLVVGSLFAIPMVVLTGTSLKYNGVIEENTLLTYAADSGVKYAICELLNSPGGFGPEELPAEVNDSVVNVAAQDLGGGVYKITSSATNNTNGSLTIRSYIKISSGFFENAISSDTTIYSQRASWITSYPDPLHGDIVAGGTYTGSGKVYGNVTVPTPEDLQGKATIYGDVFYEDYSPSVVIDTLPYQTQAMAAQGATPVTPASAWNNGGTITGDKRLSGNLALASNKALTVNGDLYIEGYVTLASGSTLTVNGNLYVGSYVNANAASTICFGGTSYVNGYMTLGKNNISEVIEVIIAKNDILFNATDNGNNALITGIINKQNNGELVGLTSSEITYITGAHSLIISETGDISTINTDNVALGGFLYAPDGTVTTHHFCKLIGALYGQEVYIDDIRQVFGGYATGPGKGAGIISWDWESYH